MEKTSGKFGGSVCALEFRHLLVGNVLTGTKIPMEDFIVDHEFGFKFCLVLKQSSNDSKSLPGLICGILMTFLHRSADLPGIDSE